MAVNSDDDDEWVGASCCVSRKHSKKYLHKVWKSHEKLMNGFFGVQSEMGREKRSIHSTLGFFNQTYKLFTRSWKFKNSCFCLNCFEIKLCCSVRKFSGNSTWLQIGVKERVSSTLDFRHTITNWKNKLNNSINKKKERNQIIWNCLKVAATNWNSLTKVESPFNLVWAGRMGEKTGKFNL